MNTTRLDYDSMSDIEKAQVDEAIRRLEELKENPSSKVSLEECREKLNQLQAELKARQRSAQSPF